MKLRTLLVAVSLVAAGLTAAHAAPISYKGVLVSGVPDSGDVGGFSWFLNQGSGVDFWEFSATAGTTITLRVDRLNGNLDPALSFYQGTTSADVSIFNSAASFGGLTFIGSLDDENPPFVGPAASAATRSAHSPSAPPASTLSQSVAATARIPASIHTGSR